MLRKLYDELASKIDSHVVAGYMFQQDELTDKELEWIQSKRSQPIGAAERLLDVVIDKPPTTYWCFLDALTQSGQQLLRKMIILESPKGQLRAYSSRRIWIRIRGECIKEGMRLSWQFYR